MRIIKPVKKRNRSQVEPSADENPFEFEVLDSKALDLSASKKKHKSSKRKSKASAPDIWPQHIAGEASGLELQSARLANNQELDLKKEYKRLLNSAVHLLSMREHSVKEIFDKLSRKTEFNDIVNAVLDELLSNKYVSDERFTESYIRARSNRGFGPIKIRAELTSKGINDILIAEFLDMNSPAWTVCAVAQHEKKYGVDAVSDYNAWTKRARFMQSRGFTMEHIQVALPEIEFD
ncbi:MAG: regulatory protein [Cryomorphaceae bacterium]|jgi:regulatory protein